ncbi:phosphate acyltransferase PlsX [Krasilnikovia sp. MM14-A1259]|uniref:phosphate acyltransferase PlsX n=1 Tax=Krasilnikovia sp. MM14-A1259 TaxID=3373539 RepID=UPI00399D4302
MAVDLLGGDHAPAVVVDGALRACQADPALKLLLVGPLDAAGAVSAALAPADRARVSVLTPGDRPDLARGSNPWTRRSTAASGAGPDRPAIAPPAAGRDASDGRVADPPAESWVESGVRAAVLAVAQGQADAVVSAGHTGATVTSAALGLGRWPGVRRPALAAVLPTAAGRLVLLDVGASIDPDEPTLGMHARLGAAYAAVVHGTDRPRVGLLTIGTERGKGDRLRRAAPAVLAGLDLPAGARYIGLVEGNDVVHGAGTDVVVTDGFTGNILLKGLETAYALSGPPTAPGAGPVSRTDLPPRAAVLLGVAGTVVVCHGAAGPDDLAAGIALAATLHRRAAASAIAAMIPHSEVTHDL